MKIVVFYRRLNLSVISKMPQLYTDIDFRFVDLDNDDWRESISDISLGNAIIVSADSPNSKFPVPINTNTNKKYDVILLFTQGTSKFEFLLWEQNKFLEAFYYNEEYIGTDIYNEIYFAVLLEKVISRFGNKIDELEKIDINEFKFD